MQINIHSLKFMLSSAIIALLLISCGAHNQNDYGDTDGIYNSDTQSNRQVAAEELNNSPSNSYYSQYFNSKTKTYQDLPEEGAIFTDIDSYSTSESIDDDGYVVVEDRQPEENYGSWGENGASVNVNVYGGNNWGNNWRVWNRPYWWYGSGFGFYNNWCSPYYGIGWGWGYPHYGNFGWGNPNFYGGYYNNFYNPYYGNAFNGYAFSRGRRNSDYYNGRNSANGSRFNFRDARNGRSIARQTERSRNNSTLTRTNNRSNRVSSTRTSSRRGAINSRLSRSSRATNSRATRNSNSRTTRSSNSRTTRSSSTRSSSNRSSNSRGVSRPSRRSSSSTRSSRSGSSRSSGSSRGGSRRGGRD